MVSPPRVQRFVAVQKHRLQARPSPRRLRRVHQGLTQDPVEQFSEEDSAPLCPGVRRLSEVAAGDRVVSGRSFQVKYGGGSRPGTWRRIFVISRCRDLLTCRTDEGRIRTYKASRILEYAEDPQEVPTQEKAEDEVPVEGAVHENSERDLFGTPLTSQERGPGEGSSSFAPAQPASLRQRESE